jgi:hypothetical protein
MAPEEPTWDADTVAINRKPTAAADIGNTPLALSNRPRTLRSRLRRFIRQAPLALLVLATASNFLIGRLDTDSKPSDDIDYPSQPMIDQMSFPALPHRRPHSNCARAHIDTKPIHNAAHPLTPPEPDISGVRAESPPARTTSVPPVTHSDAPPSHTEPSLPKSTPPGAEFGM